MKYSKNYISVIDIFCGVGGLTCGLIKSGIPVVAGYDIDASCKYAYEKNNIGAKFFHCNVKNILGSEITRQFNDAKYKVLVGCAPCQPFSKYTQGVKSPSEKWGLLYEFSRIIKETQPHIISMENVPELVRHTIFCEFMEFLQKEGYYPDTKIVYCPDYGIPQERRRLVILASKLAPITILPPTHNHKNYLTVRDVLSQTPKLCAGEKHTKDILHRCSSLSLINLTRIRHSISGGTWRDWPRELIAKCHKSNSGSTYASVYGRMQWDKPAPTITTEFFGYGNGRFGHPDQDRAISLREGAILQTFPKNYKFFPNEKELSFKKAGQMIGNAVPVKLAVIIGKTIIRHIETYKKKNGKTN
ncbi:MAG: DNA cytosine methyltransferase [Planctomycetaceae bacterium]|nr:DNA cytosine methyltransferase [Planctomycetaceae bacterium]